MSSNVIGEIGVSITGDYSQLTDDLAKATSQAQTGAEQIASAFNASSTSTDQFDASINALVESGSTLAEALARIPAPVAEIANAFGTVSDAADTAGGSATDAASAIGEAGSAAVLASDGITGLATSSDEAAGSVDKLTESETAAGEATSEALTSLSEMSEALLVFGEALAVTEGLKEFGAEAVAASDSLELATVSLTALTGSAETAETVLGNIEQIAATQPFAFPELASSAQRLAAYGVAAAAIPSILQAAGDASRGTGNSFDGVALALGRVEIQGAVTARQLYQLGVTWEDLADEAGKSVEDTQALLKKGGQSAADDMTLLIATVQDKFSDFEQVPLTLTQQWTIVQNMMHGVFAEIGAALEPVLQQVVLVLQEDIIPAVKDAVTAFNSLPQPVKDVVVGVGLLVAAVAPVAVALAGFGLAVAGVNAALPFLTSAMAALGITESTAATGTQALTLSQNEAATATVRLTEATTLSGPALTTTGVAAGSAATGLATLAGAGGSAATAFGSLQLATGDSTTGLATLSGAAGTAATAINTLNIATGSTTTGLATLTTAENGAAAAATGMTTAVNAFGYASKLIGWGVIAGEVVQLTNALWADYDAWLAGKAARADSANQDDITKAALERLYESLRDQVSGNIALSAELDIAHDKWVSGTLSTTDYGRALQAITHQTPAWIAAHTQLASSVAGFGTAAQATVAHIAELQGQVSNAQRAIDGVNAAINAGKTDFGNGVTAAMALAAAHQQLTTAQAALQSALGKTKQAAVAVTLGEADLAKAYQDDVNNAAAAAAEQNDLFAKYQANTLSAGAFAQALKLLDNIQSTASGGVKTAVQDVQDLIVKQDLATASVKNEVQAYLQLASTFGTADPIMAKLLADITTKANALGLSLDDLGIKATNFGVQIINSGKVAGPPLDDIRQNLLNTANAIGAAADKMTGLGTVSTDALSKTLTGTQAAAQGITVLSTNATGYFDNASNGFNFIHALLNTHAEDITVNGQKYGVLSGTAQTYFDDANNGLNFIHALMNQQNADLDTAAAKFPVLTSKIKDCGDQAQTSISPIQKMLQDAATASQQLADGMTATRSAGVTAANTMNSAFLTLDSTIKQNYTDLSSVGYALNTITGSSGGKSSSSSAPYQGGGFLPPNQQGVFGFSGNNQPGAGFGTPNWNPGIFGIFNPDLGIGGGGASSGFAPSTGAVPVSSGGGGGDVSDGGFAGAMESLASSVADAGVAASTAGADITRLAQSLADGGTAASTASDASAQLSQSLTDTGAAATAAGTASTQLSQSLADGGTAASTASDASAQLTQSVADGGAAASTASAAITSATSATTTTGSTLTDWLNSLSSTVTTAITAVTAGTTLPQFLNTLTAALAGATTAATTGTATLPAFVTALTTALQGFTSAAGSTGSTSAAGTPTGTLPDFIASITTALTDFANGAAADGTSLTDFITQLGSAIQGASSGNVIDEQTLLNSLGQPGLSSALTQANTGTPTLGTGSSQSESTGSPFPSTSSPTFMLDVSAWEGAGNAITSAEQAIVDAYTASGQAATTTAATVSTASTAATLAGATLSQSITDVGTAATAAATVIQGASESLGSPFPATTSPTFEQDVQAWYAVGNAAGDATSQVQSLTGSLVAFNSSAAAASAYASDPTLANFLAQIQGPTFNPNSGQVIDPDAYELAQAQIAALSSNPSGLAGFQQTTVAGPTSGNQGSTYVNSINVSGSPQLTQLATQMIQTLQRSGVRI
jgi:hypothetical protein